MSVVKLLVAHEGYPAGALVDVPNLKGLAKVAVEYEPEPDEEYKVVEYKPKKKAKK